MPLRSFVAENHLSEQSACRTPAKQSHAEIRVSGVPVFRPLAMNTDRPEWLDERVGLWATVEKRIALRRLRAPRKIATTEVRSTPSGGKDRPSRLVVPLLRGRPTIAAVTTNFRPSQRREQPTHPATFLVDV
jgi:hypothetical protein